MLRIRKYQLSEVQIFSLNKKLNKKKIKIKLTEQKLNFYLTLVSEFEVKIGGF